MRAGCWNTISQGILKIIQPVECLAVGVHMLSSGAEKLIIGVVPSPQILLNLHLLPIVNMCPDMIDLIMDASTPHPDNFTILALQHQRQVKAMIKLGPSIHRGGVLRQTRATIEHGPSIHREGALCQTKVMTEFTKGTLCDRHTCPIGHPSPLHQYLSTIPVNQQAPIPPPPKVHVGLKALHGLWMVSSP